MRRFETSAKTGANVEKAVNFLVAEILQNDKANQDRDSSSGGANTVTVGGDAPSDSVRGALAGRRLVRRLGRTDSACAAFAQDCAC